MKKNTTLLLALLYVTFSQAQDGTIWKRVTNTNTTVTAKNAGSNHTNVVSFVLDQGQLQAALSKSNSSITGKGRNVEVTVPNAKGEFEKFLVEEYSNFEPKLQEQYPDIRSYSGKGISDLTATLSISVSPQGIQSMVLRADSGSEFIEQSVTDKNNYIVFSNSTRSKGSLPLNCTTDAVAIAKNLSVKTAKTAANNRVFKTLRLALSCTGEYAQFHGGTVAGALAGMNATMTRVNGIFNKDLALKLQLISNTTSIIYLNSSSDPYSPASEGQLVVDKCASANADCPLRWSNELQTTLTSQIGSGNYDIGHLFAASGGGGNAGCIGCICNPLRNTDSNPVFQVGKGSAFTSPSDGRPQGDSFDIDFVAHELGHQLGANHTFSHIEENAGTSVEPGSGSTIMGYAGITDVYDVQAASDDYFSYASILQIQNNLATKTCPVTTMFTNATPVVSTGSNFTIPFSTAFILTGSGTDANGDNLTYTWEQTDSATTTFFANSEAITSKPDGPLFRSLYPGTSPIRYMPNYTNVLANKLTSRWESVSSVARTLNFALTARDNAALGTAQTNTATSVVTVSGTIGPFAVTSQNTDAVAWYQGQPQTVTWSVNGTNTLAGSANVTIKLSTDGGLTFPTILAASTPNDGTEVITVPNVLGQNCRIMIAPTGNIYYALNSKAFTIGYSSVSSCDIYTYSAPFDIPEQAAYTVRTITVPNSAAVVSDVNFNVAFTHTYYSDLQMEVVSPTGKTVRLFDRSCESTRGSVILTYDDSGTDLGCTVTTQQTVTPFEPLTAFNGDLAQGVWTFRIRDAFRNDNGTLDSASIQICTKTFTLGTSDFAVNDFSLYPNPNKGNFNVQFTSQSGNEIQIVVHDLLGRQLYKKAFENTGGFNQNIQLPNLQAGLYLVSVFDGDAKQVKKLVIK
ncbi:reprolysin-like metallopeptidase [Flavobacterium sp.]|uniref:zinc-dependent metalloprotease n=1 Tax=Flavobacterium sp. TaxID=239 RepID=UPI0026108C8F|nr:zinc-dependent metalloprotease family protein [Flavobacterium sp.]MDG2433054.1 zinc-dependent metalloprotease family protein [Flavobacterium sp.]